MVNLIPALNTASLKLGITLTSFPRTVLRSIPKYIIHDDGTYEIVTDAIEAVENGIQAYSNGFEAVGGAGGDYVTMPSRFQYTIPWNMDIVYEGIDMMMNMLKDAVPLAIWLFLIISGIHLFINIVHALGR